MTNPPRPGRRVFLAAMALAALTACGFEPVLAPGGQLSGYYDRIQIAEPRNRSEFVLRAELERRLGRGAAFDLSYDIAVTERDAGITPDQVITRRLIDGEAAFTLTDRASGEAVVKATVDAFTSYGTTGTTASTDFAREAAFDRLMVMLADGIVAKLALTGPVAP